MSVSGSAKETARNVCGSTGHQLVSLNINPIFDPRTRTSIPQYDVRCVRCSLTPQQIFGMRDRDKPKSKIRAAGADGPARLDTGTLN
jgi:hypothetical protein